MPVTFRVQMAIKDWVVSMARVYDPHHIYVGAIGGERMWRDEVTTIAHVELRDYL